MAAQPGGVLHLQPFFCGTLTKGGCKYQFWDAARGPAVGVKINDRFFLPSLQIEAVLSLCAPGKPG